MSSSDKKAVTKTVGDRGQKKGSDIKLLPIVNSPIAGTFFSQILTHGNCKEIYDSKVW